MTLPQKVQDAVSDVDAWLSGEPVYDDWRLIRAELHRLTEIAEGATAKVEAGNALLREVISDGYFVEQFYDEASHIYKHLQGEQS